MPHIHEKIDFTANAYIVYNNKVLLRKHDKYNMWLPPRGHIELDEDPNQAVIREVKEEVGLDITIVGTIKTFNNTNKNAVELIPPRFLNRHDIEQGATHEHIDFVYFATTKSGDVTENEAEKSEEIKWFTREELLDPKSEIRERFRHYALTALKEVGK